MRNMLRLGAPLFGAGIAAFGILSLVYRDAVAGLEPIPAGAPGRLAFALVAAVILIASGASIVTGVQARRGAALLSATLAIWVLVLHLPALARNPADPTLLTTISETLALLGAACVLWSTLVTERVRPGQRRSGKRMLAVGGRICFGLPLLVFGIQHLMYHEFVGGLVPAWMPARLLWAIITGVAFIAAGASILFRVIAGPAAALLGAMFGSWVLILHAPRVFANPASQNEWTSLFIALAMCGAAWLVGGALEAEAGRVGAGISAGDWLPRPGASGPSSLRLPDPRRLARERAGTEPGR